MGIQVVHGYTGYTWLYMAYKVYTVYARYTRVYMRMDILLLFYETVGLFGVSVS